MTGYRITLRMEGTDVDSGDVLLSDFVEELEALRKALRETEEVVAGKAVLDWRVVDLSHNSPARVVIEPVFDVTHVPAGVPDRRSTVVNGFLGYVRSLNSGVAPPELDSGTLEAFQRLASPVRQRRLRATISNGDEHAIELQASVEKTVTATLAPVSKSKGTVKGRLEFLNIHASSNVFRIYSPVLPRYVVCHFPASEILEKAKEAMGRKVSVAGVLSYHSRDAYPRSIEVTSLELLPEDSDLPGLMDLRGVDPNATGHLLSEDYVRELRSGE